MEEIHHGALQTEKNLEELENAIQNAKNPMITDMGIIVILKDETVEAETKQESLTPLSVDLSFLFTPQDDTEHKRRPSKKKEEFLLRSGKRSSKKRFRWRGKFRKGLRFLMRKGRNSSSVK